MCQPLAGPPLLTLSSRGTPKCSVSEQHGGGPTVHIAKSWYVPFPFFSPSPFLSHLLSASWHPGTLPSWHCFKTPARYLTDCTRTTHSTLNLPEWSFSSEQEPPEPTATLNHSAHGCLPAWGTTVTTTTSPTCDPPPSPDATATRRLPFRQHPQDHTTCPLHHDNGQTSEQETLARRGHSFQRPSSRKQVMTWVFKAASFYGIRILCL